MWQIRSLTASRPFTKITVYGIATAAVSAIGATAMAPATPVTGVAIMPLAAIDETNTTIGFADSDLAVYSATPERIDADLDAMQAMGVNNVRLLIPWGFVEPTEGQYDWSSADYAITAADSRGMGVAAVIFGTPSWALAPGASTVGGAPDPEAFATFAGVAAQRYAGKVGAYEVGNEVNAAMFWNPAPNAQAYTNLLKLTYPSIKAGDPNATVVAGGIASVPPGYGNVATDAVSYVQQMYADGAGQYFDALSYHPYQYGVPFSQGTTNQDLPIEQLARIHDIMVANGDGSKLIWASEYGEPTTEPGGEQQQAQYLQDMLTTWRTIDYAGPAFVWTVRDRATGSTDPEDNFGVLNADGTPKLAAYVVQAIANMSPTAARAAMAAVTPSERVALMAAAEQMAATAATQQAAPAAADVALKAAAADVSPAAIPASMLTPDALPTATPQELRRLERMTQKLERAEQKSAAAQSAAVEPASTESSVQPQPKVRRAALANPEAAPADPAPAATTPAATTQKTDKTDATAADKKTDRAAKREQQSTADTPRSVKDRPDRQSKTDRRAARSAADGDAKHSSAKAS